MLALIAEDDRNTRVLVTRLLQKLGVASLTAENGLELLALLEAHAPDLVVLDFEMPFLNGLETLQAIRSSPQYERLPVICVSAHREESVVREMIGLGLTDYLIKPINPEQALARLRPTVEAANRLRTRRGHDAVDGLMIVDPDPAGRELVRSELHRDYQIIEAASGMHAVALYRDRTPPPPVILVADGLPLLGGEQLLETFHRVAASLGVPAPRVYRLAADPAAEAVTGGRFAGVLPKTMDRRVFIEQFRRVVLRQLAMAERLDELLDGELVPELVTAVRQTLGTLTGQEVTPVEYDSGSQSWSYRSTIPLTDPDAGNGVEMSLLSDEASTVGIASKMLQMEMTIEKGAPEVLSELLNTVAGRVRASLQHRAIDLQAGAPVQAKDDPPTLPSRWPHAWSFKCAGGERVLFGLRVIGGRGSAEPAPAAEAAAPPPPTEPSADQGPSAEADRETAPTTPAPAESTEAATTG